VIGGYLNQDDAKAVRVLDPHLGQAPWLYCRPAENASAGRGKSLMFGLHVSHLEPDLRRLPRRAGRMPGDLEQSAAEEEHHRRVGRGAELPVHGEAQHVAVELSASP
jgi:hypothetical protein